MKWRSPFRIVTETYLARVRKNWFTLGYDAGWAECVKAHEQVLKDKGIGVVICSPELAKIINEAPANER